MVRIEISRVADAAVIRILTHFDEAVRVNVARPGKRRRGCLDVRDGDGRDYLLAILSSDNPSEEYGIDTVDLVSSVIWSALADASPIAEG